MDREKLQDSASGLLIAPREPVGDPFTNRNIFEIAAQQLCPPGHEIFWRKSEEMVRATRPSSAYLFAIVRNLYEGGFSACEESQLVTIRRLAFAVASDPVVGVGRRVNTLSELESACTPKLVAAFTFIYSTAHRLAEYQNERHWKQILSEALQRAEVGLLLAEERNIPLERGLLCGFATRIGSAWQVAAGDDLSASSVHEQIAAGLTWQQVGRAVYGTDSQCIAALAMVCAGIPIEEVRLVLDSADLAAAIDALIDDPARTEDKDLKVVLESGSSWPWLLPSH